MTLKGYPVDNETDRLWWQLDLLIFKEYLEFVSKWSKGQQFIDSSAKFDKDACCIAFE